MGITAWELFRHSLYVVVGWIAFNLLSCPATPPSPETTYNDPTMIPTMGSNFLGMDFTRREELWRLRGVERTWNFKTVWTHFPNLASPFC